MIDCSYCNKDIKEASYKKLKKKTGKKKNSREVVLTYHWNCWSRKMRVVKRKQWNAKNPLGGFR